MTERDIYRLYTEACTLAKRICEAAGLHPCSKKPNVVCGCAEGECKWPPREEKL